MALQRCYNCKFWATQDSGYSNYTETYVHCLKNKFESIEESSKEPENNDPFFKQAENCPEFKQETGTQISLDVDGETTIEDFKDDMEVYEAAKQYGW